MSSVSNIQHVLQTTPVTMRLILAVIAFGLIAFVFYKGSSGSSKGSSEPPHAGFPVIALDERGLDPKRSWFTDGAAVVLKGIRDTKDEIFQIIGGRGPILILPSRYWDEVRNNPALDFHEATRDFWFMDYNGFEPMLALLEDETLLAEVIRGKLTQSVGAMTHHLVDETTRSINDSLGYNSDWTTVLLKHDLMSVVSRVSSRAFLGETLCRNETWLKIAQDYATDSFIAASFLRMCPSFIRPLAHRTVPVCRRIQKEYRVASELIKPEVQRRIQRTRKALAEGKKPEKTADTIGWMLEAALKRGVAEAESFDYASVQLLMSVAGIHNTTEHCVQMIMAICEHPEIVASLRAEIIQVIGSEGWTKNSLYKLRLMDSFLKEVQRVNPPGPVDQMRKVMSDVKLSNGKTLPAGSKINFTTPYNDPNIYEHPEQFDAARFLKLRDSPDGESKWQLVSINSGHRAFGGGRYACPGRFLAAAELKIILAHLLIKYDWRHDPAGPLPRIHREGLFLTNPTVKVQCRRRKPEVDLDVVLQDEA